MEERGPQAEDVLEWQGHLARIAGVLTLGSLSAFGGCGTPVLAISDDAGETDSGVTNEGGQHDGGSGPSDASEDEGGSGPSDARKPEGGPEPSDAQSESDSGSTPDAPGQTDAQDASDAGDGGPVVLPKCGLFARPDRPIEKLTQTGCVDPSDPKKPAPYMIPYEVNSPLWSDGADKARFMRIPDGAHVHVTDCASEPTTCASDPFTGVDGHWNYPIGTVMMKIFGFEGTTVETRLLMRYDDTLWVGYSYQWNQDQTEAMVLPDARRVATFTVGTSQRSQDWYYPSRADCTSCHTPYSGVTLGTETAQFNRMEASNNQLDRLESLGILDAPLRQRLSPLATPTITSGTLEDRARSYLHANCSFCHRPDGDMPYPDFRYTRPFDFAKMGVCNALPIKGDVGAGDNARVLVPGHPEYSVISLRMKDLGLARMPMIASYRVDQEGVTVIDAWISSITSCP
jgi:uncharacterized repeat protein (TIGR03806 family)